MSFSRRTRCSFRGWRWLRSRTFCHQLRDLFLQCRLAPRINHGIFVVTFGVRLFLHDRDDFSPTISTDSKMLIRNPSEDDVWREVAPSAPASGSFSSSEFLTMTAKGAERPRRCLIRSSYCVVPS